MLSQQNAWALAKVVEPEERIAGIGNGKRLWIDSGGEAYKEG